MKMIKPMPTLSATFRRELLLVPLQGRNKRDVLREMVERMSDTGAVPTEQVDSVFKALMRREELGSTAIGKGLAVPHSKHAAVAKVLGSLGVSPAGIAFDALDGKPVHAVFLVVSPTDAAEEHLQVLRQITTIMRDDDFCRFMGQARDVDTLADLLAEADDLLAQGKNE